MLEFLILGSVQGLVEWLPLSSEGMVFLVKSNFFDHGETAMDVLRLSLFLHLGTFLAAFVYFRKEIVSLFKTMFFYRQSPDSDKKTLIFLLITTLISGGLGYVLAKVFDSFSSSFENFGKFVTVFVAALLFATGILIMKAKKQSDKRRTEGEATAKDGIILGIVQGLAVLPGFSRSGLTVSSLLFRKFDDLPAMRLSFLMSMPIIFLGNIVLNFDKEFFSWASLAGVAAAFAVGLVTINIFLGLVKKINFGYFAIVFACLMIISVFIK
jgi:undecaprenyl-diphosphatase